MEIISQAVAYGEEHPRFDTTVGNSPSAQNPGLVDERCRQLEFLHQGALHTAGEFSDDVLLLHPAHLRADLDAVLETTETIAGPYIYLYMYMLCGVYEESGICVCLQWVIFCCKQVDTNST